MIDAQQIHTLAKAAGACPEGVKKVLESGTPEELIQLYKEKIDFCLEHNFPSNEYLSENVDPLLLASHGIILNRSIILNNSALMSLLNEPDFVVLLGESSLEMKMDQYSVSHIYIKHASKAKLVIEGNAFAVIDCFDDSKLIVDTFGKAKVRINVYGNAEITVNDFDSSAVTIDRKNKVCY